MLAPPPCGISALTTRVLTVPDMQLFKDHAKIELSPPPLQHQCTNHQGIDSARYATVQGPCTHRGVPCPPPPPCGISALTTRVLTLPDMQLFKDHVQIEVCPPPPLGISALTTSLRVLTVPDMQLFWGVFADQEPQSRCAFRTLFPMRIPIRKWRQDHDPDQDRDPDATY